jgi:hypothetical protein
MEAGDIKQGLGLMLGRQVDDRILQLDPELRGIAALAFRDPEQAYGTMVLKMMVDSFEQ